MRCDGTRLGENLPTLDLASVDARSKAPMLSPAIATSRVCLYISSPDQRARCRCPNRLALRISQGADVQAGCICDNLEMSAGDKESNTDLALKTVLFSVAAVLLAVLTYKLRMLIVLLILAVTLAAAMTPIAEAGQKRKIPRTVTVVALYVLGFLSYVLLGVLLVPAVYEQWLKLNDNLPAYVSNVNTWYQHVISMAGNSSEMLVPGVDDVRNLGMKMLRQTLDMTAGIVGLITNMVLTLFLAAYFAIEADKIWAGVFKCLPEKMRLHVSPLIQPLGLRMGGYVRGQLLVAVCVALFLTLGFSLLGIRYALVLGMLAGFLNLVPYMGSFIACAFALVVAFNQSPVSAVAVLVLYAVEQWVESAFFVPLFVGNQASLHPMAVLLAIIVGASLMGVPGALISVPLASACIFLFEELYLKRLENQ